MSKLPNKVYCFHCGFKFGKGDPEGYEGCPSCGKGFSDLTEEAQYAVNMVMKAMIEHFN